VLAFIESGGSSSDFPLPIDIANASPFVAKDSEKKKFVEYRTLLLDKAGARLLEMSLWCAAGFVLVVNWCTAGDIQVTWRENVRCCSRYLLCLRATTPSGPATIGAQGVSSSMRTSRYDCCFAIADVFVLTIVFL
jgi:hypothetical protein